MTSHPVAPLAATALSPTAVAPTRLRWEAGLKCLDLALTQWTQGLAQRLALCRIMPLALTAPYGGALAMQRTA